MFKVSSSRLIDITKTLDKAYDAINNLERLNGNKVLYPQLKRELDNLSTTLKSVYDLESFEEWKGRKKEIALKK